ncbi:MAG TPA: pirin family protein [Candidatus Limnocylindria bacterium]|nr:pirin family protein [Candidatus Limnocylindria bacterium]
MEIHIRPERSIYAIDGGWFKARWHFSFDRYNDPNNMGIGTLRVFNHDTLVPGAEWPMHPHRDIEGITYVVSGHFEHADSLGNGGVLEAGGVQRMRLGSGAEHSERNHSKTEPMEFIQMWIIPSQRGLEPSIQQKQYTVADRTDQLLRFLKPEGAAGEGLTVARDVSMYVSRLSAGRDVRHEFADGRGGYLYVIDGAISANGERLSRADAAYVLGGGELTLLGEEDTDLILVDTPI